MRRDRLSRNDRPVRRPSRAVWQLRLVLVASALAITGCGGGELTSIGFGTGGVDCELEAVASTFPAGTTVRVVARFNPVPSAVSVSATKDGSPLHDPETVELDGSAPCIYGEVLDAEPGRYEYVVTIPDSQMPPLTGSFEVNPR